MKPLDLTNKKFGRLIGIRRVENLPPYKQSRWLFLCDCGTEKVTFAFNVTHGRIVSCGCLQKQTLSNLHLSNFIHGMTDAPEFNSWVAMRGRCTNHKNPAWAEYGGRGITVSPEWETFEAFYRDMGPRPAGTSLDRIDNDGPYTQENCRWATKQEQVRNRRTTTFYEHQGRSLSLQEWGEELGVPYATMWHRYNIGKRGADLLSEKRGAGGRRAA